MRPTITPNDLCIANPFAYSFGDVQRFDIVVFLPNEEERVRSNDENVRYLKRVIGLPNEKLEIRDNKIFINDELLEEPFEKVPDPSPRRKDFPAVVIPADSYFLLGDNRPESADSRWWKEPLIRRENIFSKIVDIKKDFYGN